MFQCPKPNVYIIIIVDGEGCKHVRTNNSHSRSSHACEKKFRNPIEGRAAIVQRFHPFQMGPRNGRRRPSFFQARSFLKKSDHQTVGLADSGGPAPACSFRSLSLPTALGLRPLSAKKGRRACCAGSTSAATAATWPRRSDSAARLSGRRPVGRCSTMSPLAWCVGSSKMERKSEM